jgi:hypothetical protein
MTTYSEKDSLTQNATRMEATKVRRLIRMALAMGWTVSVCDGECWTVKQSRDQHVILDALCTTGMDTVRFRDADGAKLGHVTLIYGNDPNGSEVIADGSATGPVAELWDSVEKLSRY